MAVAAFRVSLGEFAKHRQSIDWAMTQHNLGNALVRLGELEGETRRLKQSIVAFRAALKERTKDRVTAQPTPFGAIR